MVRLFIQMCWLGATALTLAQDTRDVAEPALPSACAVLTGRLAAPNGVLAEADEDRPDTERIQKAIGGCPGGQAVELRAYGKNNVFLSGPLSLKPGVTLLVDAGTALFASRNPRDYDLSPGSCGVVNEKGHGCKPFLSAEDAPGGGIMGDGVIDGRGGATLLGAQESWWDLAKSAKIYDKQQSVPRLLVVRRSNDFTLYRITLRNSPNFHVSVEQTNGFTAWGVKILTPRTARNTDGIDPSSSTNVNVLADDFFAQNLTFANDYNRTHEQLQEGSQAPALLVTGDRAVFQNVRILGNQDTLYAGSRTCKPADEAPCSTSRQYFSKCFIEGNVDFIFGDAKAVFDGCEIHSTSHAIGFITAQGKNYPQQESGFVFDRCRLTAEPGVGNVWLGRPWRPYSSVVFLNTEMGEHIDPAGWREWHPGETNSVVTSFYAEFNSSGPGGKREGRDPHTRQLSAAEAARYDARRFLSGSDRWDPAAQRQPESDAFIPRDKAAGVPIVVTLAWPPAAATSYEVSFGTTNPPPFQCRVAGTSFLLETLGAGKTYYWRVDPVTDAGVQPGTVRSFTTTRRIDRAAAYAWPIRIAESVRALYPNAAELGNWNYTDGIIIDALYRIASRTGRDGDFDYIRQYLDHFVSPEGKLDPGAYPFELFSLDRIRPASSLLWMYERTGEGKYLKAAKYVATQLDRQPRTSDGGYWHRSTYPNQMWLDGIYMADVFAVQFGSRTGQPKYFDEAVNQITLIYRHTHDPKTGLCYHGWDETKSRPWADRETGTSPEFWGRAMGWYVMAMADVMDWLPKDHRGRKEVLPIFRSLCRSLLKYQDRDTAMWYQIVDKPTAPKNYVETSCSLMYAYAMARGAQRGWLAPEYLDHARRAARGVLNRMVDLLPGNRMDIRGTVQVGSLGGNGGFYDYYVSVPVVTNDQKSIGAFMNLSVALSEIANPTGH